MTKRILNRFKRGDNVRVVFEGKVLNPIFDRYGLAGYRITVKFPEQQGSWWAVVPANTVRNQSLSRRSK